MLTDSHEKKLASDVSELVHAGDPVEAARSVSDYCNLGLKVEKPEAAVPILQHFLHHLMNTGGMEEAARMLWTPTQFTAEPQFTKDLWELFDRTNTGLIMGGGSCSKSYGIGVRIFLEWVRDPEWTTVQVIGPSEKHLEQNFLA